ncbi:MAG: ATP synthase F1 subunit epsilon [Silvibacterium sp.]|nr:ATP synthase F1 subunit epsilon [Silvibacterium sp.]MBV8438615.1 ATP synthase F1 subunit epsilon [Silvibacterium sp.]
MADTNRLQVRLVTPDHILVDQSADAVEVPARNGYLEVLYGHAPLVAVLGPGEIRFHGGEVGERVFSIGRGFVEVLPERVTILADSALRPEEIDAAAAQARLNHGHQIWNEAGDDPEKYKQAEVVIREAESRLESAKGR